MLLKSHCCRQRTEIGLHSSFDMDWMSDPHLPY